MQPSAVKPAPTGCRRRLDVACVGLVIASGRRMRPSAVKPAPTGCRRRLDVAFVGLIHRHRSSNAAKRGQARAYLLIARKRTLAPRPPSVRWARAERSLMRHFLDWRGLQGNFHVPTPSARRMLACNAAQNPSNPLIEKQYLSFCALHANFPISRSTLAAFRAASPLWMRLPASSCIAQRCVGYTTPEP